MANIAVNRPGSTILLMGNEAVARGVIEAGAGVAAAYPGSPTSEVIPALAEVAEEMNIYVEWSSNEKVATEVAAGALLAGIRSFGVMKQNGANVAARLYRQFEHDGYRQRGHGNFYFRRSGRWNRQQRTGLENHSQMDRQSADGTKQRPGSQGNDQMGF